jgi:hypothetical protein
MSEIDSYKHTCIGIVVCPSTYEIVGGNDEHRNIPLYRLEESAPEWNAKDGDLLLGGGSGESQVLRISIPEAFVGATREDAEPFRFSEDAFKAYWSMTGAFVFGEGYVKIGWHPRQPIENWLAEHIVSFVLREYPETYGRFRGPGLLRKDGSICRRPLAGSSEMDL